MSAEIILSDGSITVVDDHDFEHLSRFKWSQAKGYAKRTVVVDGRGYSIAMHRQIVGAPESLDVDHINGDRLDNRRANLRLVTRAQNVANRHPRRSSSGFYGVHPNGRHWRAQVVRNGALIFNKTFPTAIEAAVARDEAVVRFGGTGSAPLNFPERYATRAAS